MKPEDVEIRNRIRMKRILMWLATAIVAIVAVWVISHFEMISGFHGDPNCPNRMKNGFGV